MEGLAPAEFGPRGEPQDGDQDPEANQSGLIGPAEMVDTRFLRHGWIASPPAPSPCRGGGTRGKGSTALESGATSPPLHAARAVPSRGGRGRGGRHRSGERCRERGLEARATRTEGWRAWGGTDWKACAPALGYWQPRVDIGRGRPKSTPTGRGPPRGRWRGGSRGRRGARGHRRRRACRRELAWRQDS